MGELVPVGAQAPVATSVLTAPQAGGHRPASSSFRRARISVITALAKRLRSRFRSSVSKPFSLPISFQAPRRGRQVNLLDVAQRLVALDQVLALARQLAQRREAIPELVMHAAQQLVGDLPVAGLGPCRNRLRVKAPRSVTE